MTHYPNPARNVSPATNMLSRIATFLLTFVLTLPAYSADRFLVEDGKPSSVIVISDTPTRMQRVAAEEFRSQIEKISGARLPIVTAEAAASDTGQVKIYIGASAGSPVNADGLKAGAYRISSGPDWLALIGDDPDFEPVQPFARNNGDIPRAQAEWEKIAGAPYGMPSRGLYKNQLRLPGDTGKPDGAVTEPKETLGIWGLDERGSFNAVCGYLRKLGARWYLPGELGEVLPSMKSIPLPEIDETVTPDFPLRQFNFRFSTAGYDTSMWLMRLGTRSRRAGDAGVFHLLRSKLERHGERQATGRRRARSVRQGTGESRCREHLWPAPGADR